MTDLMVIQEFENSWTYVREMTTKFIEGVPAERWNFSHHPKFAPLAKQFRHMAKVYGCYAEAFTSRKLDMSKKKNMIEGPGTRENILAHLQKYDRQLASALTNLKTTGLDGFKVDVFGMSMGFTEYTHVLIHHEVSHFGTWANYAAFGGFETPASWQADWKL